MKRIALLSATTALVLPTPLLAQSTGSQEVEQEIVVTGAGKAKSVDGIEVPDSTKARAVINQDLIQRQAPGQTILNTINLVPGVNFTQSDADGSSGGNLRIRGFDGARVSLTWDGMPLNDTGNYAIYSNQQLDPELIDQVNVNLGTTDVDSPTASAAGGTVNYLTRLPGKSLGAVASASWGEEDYHRVFGMIDTGLLTDFGTRAFFAASYARNDKFKGPGEIKKQQYNARIYQPLGDNGDFISIAGHFNKNRNNFYRNPSVNDLRTLLGSTVITPSAGATASNPIVVGDFSAGQNDSVFAFDNDSGCVRLQGGPGTQRETTTPTGTTPLCTNFYGVRINPSDTGNIRVNSRFTLADNLILTVDPSFQYVLANGGGISTLAENSLLAKGSATTSPGVDFNHDGDYLDTVQFFTPNNTNTHRYGLTASLIWDATPQHRFRIAYTYDRGQHRQTGEWGYMDPVTGFPQSWFGGRNGPPVLAADGFQLQQRDRKSIALLNQVAGQYIGRFMDDRLRVELGLRAPFFQRDLDQHCYTQTGGSGFATCTSQPVGTTPIPASQGIYIVPADAVGPFPSNTVFAPFKARYKYDKLLPNAGVTYRIDANASLFASYSKGLSAPRTDNLYRAPRVDVKPETTDAFDLGVRYGSRRIQAQAAAWYIAYQNRIVTSYNQDLGISVDRNIGKVDTYGADASIAVQPVEPLTLYAFGSYIHTKIKDNVPTGSTAGVDCGSSTTSVPASCAPTAGKHVPETPTWQFGGRAELEVGPFEVGIQGKWVDDRYATDVNEVKVKGYALFDLDARYSLEAVGLKNTYVQLNVINLFDQFYFGNISTQINVAANPNFSVGAPRTIMGTLHVGL